MGSRLLNLLLCALLLGPLSSSAWAITRPENRVGGSPVFSSEFASQESVKPIGTPSENGGCGYDFASGVRIYLYCQNNPINRFDPSGNESLIEVNISSLISAGLQGFRLAGVAVAKRMALNSIYGATIGAAVGAWDAIIDDEDPYEGMANGAIGGAAFGAAGSIPGLGPAVGIGGGILTVDSVFKAVESKKYGLAAYRATVGGLLSYSAFIKAGKPVWELPPTQRGIAAQNRLAASEYSSWYEVGAENNGFFEAVDFQKGNNLVSLRTVDTRGKLSWKTRVRGYVRELAANRSATVNGQQANLILDLRVPPGQEGEASFLIDYGKQNGITVIVKSVR